MEDNILYIVSHQSFKLHLDQVLSLKNISRVAYKKVRYSKSLG